MYISQIVIKLGSDGFLHMFLRVSEFWDIRRCLSICFYAWPTSILHTYVTGYTAVILRASQPGGKWRTLSVQKLHLRFNVYMQVMMVFFFFDILVNCCSRAS